MADLLFDWLGFACFGNVKLDTDFASLVQSNPVKQEVSHTVILLLQSK